MCEPILITPIGREEFLVGKAVAVAGPTVAVAFAIFGIFLATAKLSAIPVIASAVCAGPRILIQLLFIPVARRLVDLGRDRDLRPLLRGPRRPAAQRLRHLPPLAIIALMQFNVIPASRSVLPQSCWSSTGSGGERWPRSSTASGSSPGSRS